MQTLLVIFFTLTFQNFALAGNEPTQKAVIVKAYPKKYNSAMQRHLILNRRYLKTSPEIRVAKKENTALTYTVFPPIPSDQKNENLPDSPYFPIPGNIEHKNRVKKMLPDYIWKVAPRRKRSPEKVSKVDAKNAVKPKQKVDKKNAGKATAAKTEVNATAAIKENKITEAKKEVKSTVSKKTNKTTVAKGLKITKSRLVKKKSVTKQPLNKKSALKTSTLESKLKKSRKRSRRNSVKVPKSDKPAEKAEQEENTDKDKNKTRRKRKPSASRKHQDGDSRRLTAARDASIENYPYVVSIQKDGEHWCSGALLNHRLVITTANCVWKSHGLSQMQIRAGSRYVDRDGQEAKVQEVIKHPGWSLRKNPDNDVALLFLDRFIRFSHSVHAVDIPNRIMLPSFDDVWVTSYGAERRDGIYERPGMTLQVYHARLIARDKCNNITQRYGVSVTPNFICLAQTGRRAPCTRDTGAPAVSDGVLWGLASWGIRKLCGTERFPAMFSYLASQSNMDFISKATTKLMSEARPYPFPDRYEAGAAPDVRGSKLK